MKSSLSGDDFRAMRSDLGLSRNKLAKELGVSVRAVEYWEWGMRPVPKYAENLMKCIKLARIVKERKLGPPI